LSVDLASVREPPPPKGVVGVPRYRLFGVVAALAVDFFVALRAFVVFVAFLAAVAALFVTDAVALVAFFAVLLADLTAFVEAVAFFAVAFFAVAFFAVAFLEAGAFFATVFFAGAFFAGAFFVATFFAGAFFATVFFGAAFATFLTPVAFFLTVLFAGAARFLTRSAVSEVLMAAAAPTTPSRAFLPAASAATSRVPTACPILRATLSSLFFAMTEA
jgi:hypothetical protein